MVTETPVPFNFVIHFKCLLSCYTEIKYDNIWLTGIGLNCNDKELVTQCTLDVLSQQSDENIAF